MARYNATVGHDQTETAAVWAQAASTAEPSGTLNDSDLLALFADLERNQGLSANLPLGPGHTAAHSGSSLLGCSVGPTSPRPILENYMLPQSQGICGSESSHNTSYAIWPQPLSSPSGATVSNSRPRCFAHGCGGRTFASDDNYRRHLREQSNLGKVECPYCFQQFTRKSNRDRHVSDLRCKILVEATASEILSEFATHSQGDALTLALHGSL